MRMTTAWLAAFIFLGAAALMALGLPHDLSIYDEGLILTGAMRAERGAIIHRDFYANYGPGQFYVLAALFKIFGPSALIERLWDVAIRAGIVTLAFGLAASSSRTEGVIAALLCAIWLLGVGFPGLPLFPALAFSLLALLCVAPVFKDRGTYLTAGAGGLALGATTLFRYDIGAYAAISIGIVFFARFLTHPAMRARVVGQLLSLALGLAIVCVPVAAFYHYLGVTNDFISNIIEYPAKYYWAMRSLPFPRFEALKQTPFELSVYLPPIVWLAAVFALAIGRSNSGSARTWMIGALSLLSAIFYLKGIVRVSSIHMMLSIIPGFIATVLLSGDAVVRRREPAVAMSVLCLIGVSFASYFAAKTSLSSIEAGAKWATRSSTWAPATANISPELAPCHPKAGLGRMACLSTGSDRADAVAYVRAHTNPHDFIFVGLDRHDRLFANDNLFYFLAARLPATKYSHFDPGLQTRADIQGFIIDEIRSRKPELVVRDASLSGFVEPNASVVSSGVVLLDKYIDATYRPVQKYGPYTIMERRADR